MVRVEERMRQENSETVEGAGRHKQIGQRFELRVCTTSKSPEALASPAEESGESEPMSTSVNCAASGTADPSRDIGP